ncbi:Glutaredoxin [Macleaya cordata]|uniref:Glutaredoxin n=1 Tax=Macleaya cordata TaxID=56857 RepID=A0A200Q9V6_MACCD|nr:Glutaredoxin [Macleaya cordata]
MKGVKGRFLKKLKSIKPLATLKQADRVLHFNVSDGWLSNSLQTDTDNCRGQDQMTHHCKSTVLESDIIDVSELMKDLEDEEMEFGEDVGNKENIGPLIKPNDTSMSTKANSENLILSDSRKSFNLEITPLSELDDQMPNSRTPPSSDSPNPNFRRGQPLSEIDVLSFRRPDLNSRTLFDPYLLAAFEQAVMDHMRAQEAERKARIERENLEREREKEKEEEEPPLKARRVDDNPLLEFEKKCPPGGSESVILYTTSLRGIRKTFEDCCSIRFLLGNFKFLYYERDVSMHLEFREELWSILGCRVVPPKLFIKGRYIGGADEVIGLHEQGKLLQLFQGIPKDQSNRPCDGCGGVRFILCFKCNGSRKVENDDGDEGLRIQCPQCNENGLIICPFCS